VRDTDVHEEKRRDQDDRSDRNTKSFINKNSKYFGAIENCPVFNSQSNARTKENATKNGNNQFVFGNGLEIRLMKLLFRPDRFSENLSGLVYFSFLQAYAHIRFVEEEAPH